MGKLFAILVLGVSVSACVHDQYPVAYYPAAYGPPSCFWSYRCNPPPRRYKVVQVHHRNRPAYVVPPYYDVGPPYWPNDGRPNPYENTFNQVDCDKVLKDLGNQAAGCAN